MRTATVITIAALTLACGPSVTGRENKDALQEQKMHRSVRPVPRGWPNQWGERKLHRYEHALVYAQKKSTADEFIEMLHRVVEDVRQAGLTAPTGGLIVVIDAKEKFPIEIGLLTEMLSDPNTPAAGERSKEILNSIKEARKLSDRARTDVNSLVSVISIPLTPAALPKTAREFPEGVDRDIAWCIIVPTDRYVRASMRAVMDAMVKVDKMNWKERLLIGALTPLAQHVAGKEIRKTRRADLYQLLVEGQGDLSEEVKKEKIKAYRQRLGLEGASTRDGDKEGTTVTQTQDGPRP